MPAETSTEKRGRRRTPLALRASIKFFSAAGNLSFCGSTRDVSNTGAYLWCGQGAISEQKPVRGDRLHITLNVPPDEGRQWSLNLKCEAKVVRVESSPNQREFGLAVHINRFRIPKVVRVPDVVPMGHICVPSQNRWIN